MAQPERSPELESAIFYGSECYVLIKENENVLLK